MSLMCCLKVFDWPRRQRRSVQIDSENTGSYEYFLFDDRHSRQVVSVFIPKLAGAHAYTLTLILTDDHLDEILVSGILVKPMHTLLGILCQVPH